MNNFLSLFPGSDASKKIEMEELNGILLHAVTNGWSNQFYPQGWYFELNTYRETCAMYKRMEVAEHIYEGGTSSKIPTRAESNHGGHIRKRKGGEGASPTNPEMGHAGKGRTKNTGHLIDVPTTAKKTCSLHGPGHSSEDCKVIKVYSENYVTQRPNKST